MIWLRSCLVPHSSPPIIPPHLLTPYPHHSPLPPPLPFPGACGALQGRNCGERHSEQPGWAAGMEKYSHIGASVFKLTTLLLSTGDGLPGIPLKALKQYIHTYDVHSTLPYCRVCCWKLCRHLTPTTPATCRMQLSSRYVGDVCTGMGGGEL